MQRTSTTPMQGAAPHRYVCMWPYATKACAASATPQPSTLCAYQVKHTCTAPDARMWQYLDKVPASERHTAAAAPPSCYVVITQAKYSSIVCTAQCIVCVCVVLLPGTWDGSRGAFGTSRCTAHANVMCRRLGTALLGPATHTHTTDVGRLCCPPPPVPQRPKLPTSQTEWKKSKATTLPPAPPPAPCAWHACPRPPRRMPALPIPLQRSAARLARCFSAPVGAAAGAIATEPIAAAGAAFRPQAAERARPRGHRLHHAVAGGRVDDDGQPGCK